MSNGDMADVGEILDRISDWPAADRLRLAQEILGGVSRDLRSRPARGTSLKDLLGLLDLGAPPPSDEECQRILEDELLRKHGG
jgi:hypothetical protein